MIKTLYVRVVLTYLAAVMIGLISAYSLSLYFINSLGDRYIAKYQAELIKDGYTIEKLLQKNGIENANAMLKQERYSKRYEVKLYDSSRVLRRIDGKESEDLFMIPDQVVQSVLDGETYKGVDIDPTEFVIGMPYEESGKRYALFIQTSEATMLSFTSLLLVIVLFINVFVGCIIIIVGARYLVRPLRGMTVATEQLARGNFDIQLKWSNRKDELGELSRSFSYMASQIQQLEVMRQAFVSNVSHEIQSPLTSISGFSKALQEKDLSEEESIRYLKIIQQESERVSRLSENLLKLASLDSQHHPFALQLYDLDEQLRKVVVACEPQWSAKALELEMKLSRTKIRADEDQLSQVWVNIISNSIKFTPEGGKIRISIVKSIGSIEVRIADTGIGIPKEEQVKVFERFYKVDKSHTKTKSGNGLGLAIVKKIVSLHGGSIDLKSNSDAGITVSVTLPHNT